MQNIPKLSKRFQYNFLIVSVLTDQEKEKTDSDFAYYNMKADG